MQTVQTIPLVLFHPLVLETDPTIYFFYNSDVSTYLVLNNMQLDPPKIVYLPSESRAADQQRVSLECKAEGSPKPSYTWTPCTQNVCNESILVLLEVRYDAVYKCTVENELGKDSAEYSIGKDWPLMLILFCLTLGNCEFLLHVITGNDCTIQNLQHQSLLPHMYMYVFGSLKVTDPYPPPPEINGTG